jgi:hypothetical protein
MDNEGIQGSGGIVPYMLNFTEANETSWNGCGSNDHGLISGII